MSGSWNRGDMGKYIRYEAKGRARELANIWAETIPEPVPEKLKKKSSLIILNWRDHFISRDLEQEDDKLFRGVFNQWAVINDFDIFWRERTSRLVKLIKECDWPDEPGKDKPRYQWWMEPRDAPVFENLVDGLKWERFKAFKRRDGLAVSRLKALQNMAEGLNIKDRRCEKCQHDFTLREGEVLSLLQ